MHVPAWASFLSCHYYCHCYCHCSMDVQPDLQLTCSHQRPGAADDKATASIHVPQASSTAPTPCGSSPAGCCGPRGSLESGCSSSSSSAQALHQHMGAGEVQAVKSVSLSAAATTALSSAAATTASSSAAATTACSTGTNTGCFSSLNLNPDPGAVAAAAAGSSRTHCCLGPNPNQELLFSGGSEPGPDAGGSNGCQMQREQHAVLVPLGAGKDSITLFEMLKVRRGSKAGKF